MKFLKGQANQDGSAVTIEAETETGSLDVVISHEALMQWPMLMLPLIGRVRDAMSKLRAITSYKATGFDVMRNGADPQGAVLAIGFAKRDLRQLFLALDKETLAAVKAGLASLDSPSAPVFKGKAN
jgi:hypothetical protein